MAKRSQTIAHSFPLPECETISIFVCLCSVLTYLLLLFNVPLQIKFSMRKLFWGAISTRHSQQPVSYWFADIYSHHAEHFWMRKSSLRCRPRVTCTHSQRVSWLGGCIHFVPSFPVGRDPLRKRIMCYNNNSNHSYIFTRFRYSIRLCWCGRAENMVSGQNCT